MIRVMIADDSDIAADGMRRILEQTADMEVVCEGRTKLETIELALLHRPDILLLDLMWFDDKEAGLDVIRQLAQDLPETQIVAITVYPSLIERARAAGARSAVNKSIPRRQLIEEIRGVHRVPRSGADMSTRDERNPQVPVEPLTERQLEVLALMADGMTDQMIAQDLSIARATARNHVSNIMAKLGAPNRTAAVTRAYRLGLLGGDER